MIFHRFDSLSLVAFVLAITVAGSPALAERNDGQDVTRPINRFDVRTWFNKDINVPGNNSDAEGVSSILRFDIPIPTSWGDEKNPWVFYYRTDFPFVVNQVPSADNREGDWEFGTGDWFHQMVMITPKHDYPLGIDVFGFGIQAILDTASQDQFGTGQYRLVPLFAWKWTFFDDGAIPGVENVQFIPIFKFDHELSFIDGDGNRNQVRNFQFKPQINIKLPDRWFITLWETADIKLELSRDSKDQKDWSVPIDVMVGKVSDRCLFVEQCVYSFNYIDYVYNSWRIEDWSMQARIGLFF